MPLGAFGRLAASRRIIIRKGNENKAGARHSVYRHYGTTNSSFEAEDILNIPDALSTGKRTQKTDKGKPVNEYTLQGRGEETLHVITSDESGREVFITFYKTKEASPVARLTHSEEARAATDNTSTGKVTDNISSGQANQQENNDLPPKSSGRNGIDRFSSPSPTDNHKQRQLAIILRSNPMHDNIHLGIRSTKDIKTFEEAYDEGRKEAEKYGYDEFASYPDISNQMVEEARQNGKIRVYSSHPIQEGTFVTPSKMQARDYAGGGKVYSREVPLEDVAWINLDEGQYTPNSTTLYSLPENFSTARQSLEHSGISIDDEKLKKEFGLSDIILSKNGDIVTIDKLKAVKTGQGDGTRFMKALAEEADRNGWTLALTPSTDFGATSVSRLKQFYKQFGFKDNKGHNTDFRTRQSMVREPVDMTDDESRFSFSNSRAEFEKTQKEAVEKKGIVMPGLNERQVPVIEVPIHSFSGESPIKQARKWAKENIVGTHTLNDSDGNQIEYTISGKAVGKFLSESATKKSDSLGAHLSVLTKLPEVIAGSVEAEVHPDYQKGTDGTRSPENGFDSRKLVHRFYGAANIDGKTHRIRTTITESVEDGTNSPHSFEVTEIELLDDPMADGNNHTVNVGQHEADTKDRLSNNSIPLAI